MNKVIRDILEVLSLPILVALIVFMIYGEVISKLSSSFIGNKIIDLLEIGR